MSIIYTWIATIIALAGTALNVKKVRVCFALWLITNAMWLAWDIAHGLYSRGLLDAVQFVLAAWGLYEWGHDAD